MKLEGSIASYSVYLVLALVLVSACSTTTVEEKPPLAVMPSTGTVEFSQLASVFSSTCLANYPNTKGAASALEKLGFTPIEPNHSSSNDYWQLFDNNREMYATVGKRVIVFTGDRWGRGDGAVIQNVCNVSAELKDAENYSVEPLVLLAPSGDEISLKSVDGHDFSKSAELLTQDGIANVNFKQSRNFQRPIQGQLPEVCNGLSDCITWAEATLEVWMTLDE
ncbi:hypothetical protein [Ruegeria arenilitoris]|uniref:hypothetical protein n=1 Tax=Ruegeria arenilitoris TaxID=1173585 RepID=UPI00147F8B85|nr:hypothetical protein [Ruegeria arenilitoris]